MSTLRRRDRRFYARVFALLAAAGVGVLVFQVLAPIFQPLCWALLIAALLHPAQRRLTARLGDRRSLAATLLTIGVFLVVAGPVAGVSGLIATEVGDLVAKARERGSNALKIPELAEVPVAGQPLDNLRKDMRVSNNSVRKWVHQRFDTGLAALAPLSGKLFVGVVGTMTSFAIMLVVLFFSLRDGAQLVSSTAELIPWPEGVKIALSAELTALLRAVVFGTVATAVLQGVLVGAAFAVLDLRAPVVFGAIAALLAMLPVGGTAFVWGPAVIVLAMQDRWIGASALAVWGILMVGTIDNLLQPYLVAHRARIGTMTIFIGVIGGLGAFGLLGVVVGPLILALSRALLRLVREPAPASREENLHLGAD